MSQQVASIARGLTEAEAGATAYAGSSLRRGAATAEVIATGMRTYFGRTAERVRSMAKTETHLTRLILRIVRYLVTLDVVLVLAVFLYRRISRRMLTSTLNKIVRTIEVALFLSVGVMHAGE